MQAQFTPPSGNLAVAQGCPRPALLHLIFMAFYRMADLSDGGTERAYLGMSAAKSISGIVGKLVRGGHDGTRDGFSCYS